MTTKLFLRICNLQLSSCRQQHDGPVAPGRQTTDPTLERPSPSKISNNTLIIVNEFSANHRVAAAHKGGHLRLSMHEVLQARSASCEVLCVQESKVLREGLSEG